MMDSNISTVTITVNPVNDAPIATNDNYALDQDTSMTVPVMNNDSDIDSIALSITGLTSPIHGIATINGTGVEYTPTSLYVGPDSFSYQIVDDMGLISGTATINMNVVSTNTPPTANDSNLSMNEDAILSANVT
jgi:large repetitive protein